MLHGHEILLNTPTTSSELHTLVETMRSHHYAMADQTGALTAELKRNLSRVPGRKGMGGLDSQLAAAAVARLLRHAAAYDINAAKAWTGAYMKFVGAYLGAEALRQKGFDVNK